MQSVQPSPLATPDIFTLPRRWHCLVIGRFLHADRLSSLQGILQTLAWEREDGASWNVELAKSRWCWEHALQMSLTSAVSGHQGKHPLSTLLVDHFQEGAGQKSTNRASRRKTLLQGYTAPVREFLHSQSALCIWVIPNIKGSH